MSGFFTAPQIALGPGAIEPLSGLAVARALLLVDPAVARAGSHRRVVEELEKANAQVEVAPAIPGEPTLASLAPAVERARALRPDWIVAVGGGSTIDAAKGVWLQVARPDVALTEVTPLVELNLRASARLVAVPTTSGSGSEAAWTAHLRDEEGRLVEPSSRELVPDWALLDPGLVTTMPPALTAETGAEFVAQALEALVSEWASPFTDALARDAIGVGLTALPRAYRHGDELEIRTRLHAAATEAGIAVSNAQAGVGRALATALGGLVRAPHARLLAALLPYVVEFNYPPAREKFLSLSGVLGAAAVQHRSALSEKLRTVWDQVGLPRTLVAAGVSADQIASVREEVLRRALAATSTVANPRVPNESELGRLLDAAVGGLAVGF